MKKPEEIKKGIVEAIEEVSWVVEGGDAHDLQDACDKAHASMADALAIIEQLERERDAAVAELKGYGCASCKYLMFPSTYTCGEKCIDFCNWEWHGVKEENHDN